MSATDQRDGLAAEVHGGRSRTELEEIETAPTRRSPRGLTSLVTWLNPLFDVIGITIAATLAGSQNRGAGWYVLVAMPLTIACAGGYRPRIAPTLGDSLPSIVGAMAAPVLGLPLLLRDDAALVDAMRFAPLAAAAVVASRACSYSLVRRIRRIGLVVEPTLIIGAGTQGMLIAEVLRDHPEFGLVPIGFLDLFDDDLTPPIVGDTAVLDRVLEKFDVRRVIVAFGGTREPEIVRILRECDRHKVQIYVLPRFFELGIAQTGTTTEHLWGIPLVHLRRSALRGAAWRAKRAIDVVGAGVALLIWSPVIAACALAVKRTSPGPVLFRQRRVGQRGECFEMLKFRTMPMNEDSDVTWSVAKDERLTPVGRLLRRTSLDELPQLFNVLRGDMSLVGPRPERELYVERFGAGIPRYRDRHRVPVGMTGWAQVHRLRGNTSIEERARFDNHYIEHWSLWRDLVILVRTVRASWQRD